MCVRPPTEPKSQELAVLFNFRKPLHVIRSSHLKLMQMVWNRWDITPCVSLPAAKGPLHIRVECKKLQIPVNIWLDSNEKVEDILRKYIQLFIKKIYVN